MRRKKPIIGVCGGIGAGKSLVATEFERLGCVTIDSDQLNHQVLRRPEVLETLRQWWGGEAVTPTGDPDRGRIAKIVFADAAERRRLEELVYPLIAGLRADMISAANKDRAVKAIILDSPLLFESNLDRLCDTIVYVEASRARRLQRLKRKVRWSEEQLRQRERWQLPLSDKRARSEFAVDNEGPPERLRPQVTDILEKVLSRHTVGQ